MKKESMFRTSRYLQYGFAILMLLVLTTPGCKGKLDSSVSGKVTLDGQPMDLETGAVSFHPISGGPVAQASIGMDGYYEVKTGKSEGLPAGDYLVTVVATGLGPKPAPGEVPMPGPLLTPMRYNDREQTDLKFTIHTGVNKIDIPLKSHP